MRSAKQLGSFAVHVVAGVGQATSILYVPRLSVGLLLGLSTTMSPTPLIVPLAAYVVRWDLICLSSLVCPVHNTRPRSTVAVTSLLGTPDMSPVRVSVLFQVIVPL